jgi:hypothetical protein
MGLTFREVASVATVFSLWTAFCHVALLSVWGLSFLEGSSSSLPGLQFRVENLVRTFEGKVNATSSVCRPMYETLWTQALPFITQLTLGKRFSSPFRESDLIIALQ